MEKWIKERFNIEKPYDYNNDESEYISFSYNERQTMIPLRIFLDYCKGLEAPLTVDKLKTIDEGDKIGWHPFFDSWKVQGLIS